MRWRNVQPTCGDINIHAPATDFQIVQAGSLTNSGGIRKHSQDDSIWNIIYRILPTCCLCTIICILLAQLPLPNLPNDGIGIYSGHLKKLYAQHNVSSGGGKWPATKVNKFINLAIVSYTSHDQDKKKEHLVHGNIEEILTSKKHIDLDSIFKSELKGPSLIFVEGAPGIGKSTLVWELCRRWANNSSFMKHFSLVVLHRLRDNNTQKIKSVHDLFVYEDEHLQHLVSDIVTASDGKGVLFILDGFDEFPHRTSGENYLIKLITKHVLPESTVLVTTRPAATATFFHHEPSVDRHIEILGFTEEQVEEFASEAFAEGEPEILVNFLNEAFDNPVIASLMYIPLNAVIIIDMYKSNGRSIPPTQTQLYKELCLTQLRRHLISNDPLHFSSKFIDLDQWYKLDEIEDLSKYDNFYMHFQNLSQLAFNEFVNENIIFYTLPSGLDHFGVLDKAPALHGRGQASYNFMHLTIQEFLAAYHIVCYDSSEKRVFQEYGSSKRWNLVWKFVAGLSKFNYFENSTNDEVFVRPYSNRLEIDMYFIVGLYEAEVISDFDVEQNFEGLEPFHIILPRYTSPGDMYAISYFLVNAVFTTSWEIKIEGHAPLELFVRYLNSVEFCKTNVSLSLEVFITIELSLSTLPVCIFRHISQLHLSSNDWYYFAKVATLMMNLESLYISEMYCNELCFQNILISLSRLYNPPFGSLKNLIWTGRSHDVSMLDMSSHGSTSLDILFGSTSLESLEVTCGVNNWFPSFALLSKNKNLKSLTLHMTTTPPLDSLMAVLEHNTELQTFTLYLSELTADCGSLKLFVVEFLKLSKFESLQLWIRGTYPSMEKDYDELRMDPRFDMKFTFQNTPALHIRR